MITDTMLGLNGIDPSRLSRMKVKEVMQKDVPVITLPYNIEEIMHLLIDQPFWWSLMTKGALPES